MALTSYIFHFEVLDVSSTAGVGLAGKTYSDFTVKSIKPGGELTAMTTETITTLGTFQAPTSAAHIRIKELNSADPTKGIYEAHLSDSLLSSGSKVTVFFSVSGGKAQPVEIDLVDVKSTNVTQFGGMNGTFSGGRPEVNATHWGGTAVASANVLIDGAITAAKIADNAITDAKVASDVTIASVTNAVTVGTNNDKTGYKLASDGLDSISTTAPSGVAANFREMMVQIWRRMFKKSTLRNDTNELKTYADDGTTVLTTQAVSDNGTTQEIGAAT